MVLSDFNSTSHEVRPIGVIRSCYREKFGIPRQPGLVREARATVELIAPYCREEMVKGLARFSHIWIVFLFHDSVAEGWKPTVRPPGLGGQKRVGVFASRSPHRPNHIGISAVELIEVIEGGDGIHLEIGGGDLLDGTPVIDIKPYAPFSDAIPHAAAGYSALRVSGGEVELSENVVDFCREYQRKTGRDLAALIISVLRQDPRPASQRNTERNFGMILWDINIRWSARDNIFEVFECSYLGENEKQGGISGKS